MRPLRLDVAGFTVFREPATLDLTGADLFALVGPTGSGKSTLLDAICFALYGTVPRSGKRGGVGGVLGPSAAEARVRLVFEAGGARYVATRVVRRIGKAGTPQTKHAGLERLHPDFDLSTLDTGLDAEQLGDVLAGSPSEMDAAVEKAVGLPYEQFVTCVILPQGAFAEFLHATPASRQQILVNLLGLGVYDTVREKAHEVALVAEGELKSIERQLAGGVPTDEALADASRRLERLGALAADVDAALPGLASAETAADEAAKGLRAAEDQLRTIGAVTAPADTDTLVVRAADALAAVARADAEVAGAEAAEEQLLRARDTAGDPASLAKLLDAYERADEIPAEIDRHAAALALAEGAHAAATSTLEGAARALGAAEAARDAARTGELAAALRGHLRAGDDCPVCLRTVDEVPDVPPSALLTAAERDVTTARTGHEAALRRHRDTDREEAAARTKLDDARARLERATAWFVGRPDRVEVAASLAAAHDLAKRLDAAGSELRTLRRHRLTCGTELDAARGAVQRAWAGYDRVRDGLSVLGPPAADREDLAGSWAALAAWAGDRAATLRAARDGAALVASGAAGALTAARAAVDALFAAAEVPRTGNPVRDAAVAVERASALLAGLTDARDRAARLATERDGHQRDVTVAKALAQHLNANNFKRWLLAEALDQLVDGASTLLMELSSGQYELGHDKGDFYVVDHHDAEQHRAVRTLSGGETFQASLALALALSDRLAGMSSNATTLGAIILDEGFGTLDAATLDMVAATLENLAARGDRLVGVVTHVPALAERIPVRYEVRKNAQSAYVERVT
ncbi:SMC family ATPase [Longispora sp. NPDC051575]|uniref:SMC family ATPase n=1 Tax=Longispora sp. NPDC051575 TaxID=3154943 RepID=UPI003438F0F0